MTITETIVSSINDRLGINSDFKEFEDKKYFVVNGKMTNVYLNNTLFKELESLNQYVGHEGAQKLINSTADTYIDALQAWINMEENNEK